MNSKQSFYWFKVCFFWQHFNICNPERSPALTPLQWFDQVVGRSVVKRVLKSCKKFGRYCKNTVYLNLFFFFLWCLMLNTGKYSIYKNYILHCDIITSAALSLMTIYFDSSFWGEKKNQKVFKSENTSPSSPRILLFSHGNIFDFPVKCFTHFLFHHRLNHSFTLFCCCLWF